MDFTDTQGRVLPIGRICVSKVYDHLNRAVELGYTLISEQGGTRSSKTVTTMIWCVEQALKKPIKIGILRKTFPTLRYSVLQDFIHVMEQLGQYKESRFNKTEHVYRMENGSEFWFIAADEAEKLKGFECDIMWLNEATEFKFDDYQQLRFRCRGLMILDYNPNFPDRHWLCKYVNDKSDDYTKPDTAAVDTENRQRNYFFITTYRDNPFLSQVQVDEIESLRTSNLSLYQMFGNGIRCVLQGRVFPSIDVVPRIPQGLKHNYVGVDYGYGNAPTAIVKVAIEGKDVYLEEIRYQVGLKPREIADIMNKDLRIKGLEVIADSANTLINNEVQENGQFKLTRVNKGGRVGAQVKDESILMMQQYNIHIVAGSDNVLSEFESYVFKQGADGEFTNEPVKIHDHSIDATRYVLIMRAFKRHKKGIMYFR